MDETQSIYSYQMFQDKPMRDPHPHGHSGSRKQNLYWESICSLGTCPNHSVPALA